MVSERDVAAAIGTTAYGSDGASVGTVETFYTDDRTGATTWVSLSSGLLGTRHALAPAEDATFADGRLQLTVPSGAVSGAPRLGGQHLSPEDEAALRSHYADAAAAGRPAADDATTGATEPAAAADRPAAGAPEPDDGSMVRSEEQLRVGTERVATRRMRVVKYVVTEEVQVTVPLRREEIRIEEVPLDAGGDDGVLVTEGEALSGPGTTGGAVPDATVPDATVPGGTAAGGLPDEIVLHAERPVVSVEVVAAERVRLRTELVQGQESVSGTVQREQVVVDEDPPLRG
jgi:stress response protein YsnF